MSRYLLLLLLLLLPLLFQFAWTQNDSTEFNQEEIFEWANQYLESQDYFSAVELYRKLLTISPDNLEARYNLAHAYYEIYESLNSKGYLALSIFTYEQILTIEEIAPSGENKISDWAAENLRKIRKNYKLSSPAIPSWKTSVKMVRMYREWIIHGLGGVFILTAIFFIVAFISSPPDPNIQNAVREKPEDRKTILKKFWQPLQAYGQTQLHTFRILFWICLVIYLILSPLVWMKPTHLPGLNIGVTNQDSALRLSPTALDRPFMQIREGETVSILETSNAGDGKTWVKVKINEGEGWLLEEEVLVVSPYSLTSPPSLALSNPKE